jgi:hypothetical protein
MVRTKVIWELAAIASLAIAVACGDDSNPGGPSGGNGTGGNPGSGTTITISNSGVSPNSLTVPRGTQVTFMNSSSRVHEMASDPHPTHGSCPEIENGVGFLSVGQSKQTGNLNTVGTCRYHDHNDALNTSLQGSITIQ